VIKSVAMKTQTFAKDVDNFVDMCIAHVQ